MDKSIDKEKTIEIIETLKLAKIGDYKKWKLLIKKIKTDIPLNLEEIEYFSTLTRIYKESKISKRTRIYHTKLSDYDEKPPCQTCGDFSEYYCNMNDEYFCSIHVVGHDENEI
mgnify:CR=1 FL=1